MITKYFRLALNSLRHRRKRSWLTIIGTLIGIMAVVSLISVGQGLENSVESELDRLGGDKVFVLPGGGLSGRFSDKTFELTEDDLDTIKNSNSIEASAGLVSGNVQTSYRRQKEFSTVLGVETGENREKALEMYPLEVEDGRYVRQTDLSSVLVEEDVKADNFDEEVIMRSSVEIKGKGYKTIGEYSTSGPVQGISGFMMPISEARQVLDKDDDQYDRIISRVRDGYTPEEASKEVERRLRNERDVGEGSEDFIVRTADDIIRSFRNQLNIIRAVLIGIGSISLFVGGIGIMNTMYTSVTERTREIGVMKAVGATKTQILLLFTVESGIVGAIGGLLGVTLGIGISFLAGILINQQVPVSFTPYVSIELILGAILFSFIVGVISGILPARKASKKQPVEALRYE